jgi:hypothetical protein
LQHGLLSCFVHNAGTGGFDEPYQLPMQPVDEGDIFSLEGGDEQDGKNTGEETMDAAVLDDGNNDEGETMPRVGASVTRNQATKKGCEQMVVVLQYRK